MAGQRRVHCSYCRTTQSSEHTKKGSLEQSDDAATLLVAAGHLHAGVAGDVVPQQLPAGPLPRHYLHPVQQRHHAASVHYTTRHQ